MVDMNQLSVRYAHHLVVSAWRRKSLMIMAVMVTFLLIICLQYSSVGGHSENSSKNIFENRQDFPLGLQGSKQHQEVPPRRNLSGLASLSKDNRPDSLADSLSGSVIRQPQLLHDDTAVQIAKELPNGNHIPMHLEDQQKRSDHVFDNVAHSKVDMNSHNWQGQNIAQVRVDKQPYIPGYRLVHLDMKGAPPKLSYLKQLFPILKEAGSNGIILEYEDMFPFWGPLSSFAAGNAYSKDDIKAILKLAMSYKFEVIPLVQTFGHMEFVLKLEEFRHLREVDEFPQSVCPSRNESVSLIESMIDQVLMMHPKTKWLHIGCDEVYHLGYCDKCAHYDRDTLFLKHVAKIATYVRQKHNVIPIIWDDMLRNIPTETLKEFRLGSLVEPMIWTYVKDIYRFVPYSVWITYSEVFPFIWAASAFKGAFGETLTIPNVKMHLENNEAWLEAMSEQFNKFESFRGIVLAGWQRYDHFGTLCELLPSGVPSLVVNLLTVTQGYFDQQIFNKFHKILQCTIYPSGSVDFESDLHLWNRASGCFFPGSPVFRMTQHHDEAIKKVNEYLYDVTIHKAWLTDYNIRHNLTSIMRVDEGLTEYTSVYYPLTSLVRTARDALREVYDEYTVSEWIEQNIYPYIMKMEKLWKNGMDLKKAKVWPKRPLQPLEELKRFHVGTDDVNNV